MICQVEDALPGSEQLPGSAAAEPEVRLRRSIAQLDYNILDSWDFDVFYYMPEQLVAYVALMFMSLGLTAQDVRFCGPPAE